MKYTVHIKTDGTYWYKENNLMLHRINGPAIEYNNGDKHWYQDGKRHCSDGPAIEHFSGTKEWYVNGKKHRLGGPAVEYFNGDKSWWQNDKLHRLDGPAIEHVNGDKCYYIEGKQYSKEDFDNKVKELSNTCENKIIEIDGIKYKLTKI